MEENLSSTPMILGFSEVYHFEGFFFFWRLKVEKGFGIPQKNLAVGRVKTHLKEIAVALNRMS